MKVIHITPSYYPAVKYGGPIQSVHLLNKFLIKKGCKVDVLTTNAGLSRGQRSEVRGQWNDVDGVRVRYVSFIGYEHFNFSLSFVSELKRIISNYDLVHITAVWNFPVLAGSLMSILKNKPYIISPKGTIHKETIELKSFFKKRFYWWFFAKHYINKAAAIHFTTSDEEKKVKDYFTLKNDSFIVPNGIDLSKIEFKENKLIDTDKKYILSLGRITKIKGFDLLIPAFSKLTKEYNIYLVIAGPDNEGYKKEVVDLIKKENLESRIIFTGLINEEKWSIYKNALMFVLPSYSENFGISVIEAMACGTPVIISNKVGIWRGIKENNAGMVVETNVESIKAGMEKILTDGEYRIKISENAKKLIEEIYDINNVASQMISQYMLTLKNYKK